VEQTPAECPDVASSPPAAATALGERTGGRHGATVVDSREELVALGAGYLAEGLDAGDLVLVSAHPETVELLRRALGLRADEVHTDPAASLLGSRPPDALALTGRWLERAAGERSGRLRALAEVDPGPRPADWRECQRFESVANRFLLDARFSGVCVYDRSRLAAPLVESVPATHPEVLTASGWLPSPSFTEPDAYLRSLSVVPEPEESGAPVFTTDDAPALPWLRHRLIEAVDAAVPDLDQRDDLHLALAEIAANAFRHGRRPVAARVWASAERLVCTISDTGTGFSDPGAGYLPAHGADLSRGGMGLWLARKLCDHVDLVPGPHGLTVRLVVGLH
jgi:anti-sigma regulatory factor (Ser/Thr protein kinase)